MASIPKLKDLFNDIKADLEASLNVVIFGKSNLIALASVWAGKLRLFYTGIAFNLRNQWVDKADPESQGGTLERFGRVKLGRDPFAATAGIYTIVVTGTIGGTIRAGITFKSNDDSLNPGKLFVLDSAHVMVTTADQIQVRALEGGLESQLSLSDKLTATEPISLVDSEATVFSEDTIPLAAEDLEDYRAKTEEAFRLESQGGAGGDYRIWAADAQGVQKVYPYAKSGEDGVVDLYVEATKVDSVDGKGTPTAAILSSVEEVVEFEPDTTKPLNERGRRPLTTFIVNYLAVSPKDVIITITGATGFTTEVETAVENALIDFIDSVRPFIAGVDIVAERNDELTKTKLIQVVANNIPASASFDDLTFTVDAVPVPVSIMFEFGDIPVLDTISYV